VTICLLSDAAVCETATTTVTTTTNVDKVTITTYNYVNRQGGTINVVAQSNNVLNNEDTGANLQLSINGGAFQSMTQDGGINTGTYSFNARSIGRQPTSIEVRSQRGAVPARTSAFIKRAAQRLNSISK